MPDYFEFIAILLTFLLAGTVKGVIGLGLPTVSLAMLTLMADLPTAMALMLLPSLVTNVWQALAGEYTRQAISRFWPMLLLCGFTVLAGGLLFTRLRLDLLTALLGILILLYSVASLAGFKLSIPSSSEKRLGLLCGGINGVLTGLTGSSVVPGVMYLQALQMPRRMFIQSMGLLFSISTLALAASLWFNGLLGESVTRQSMWGVAPALLGMPLGRWLGQHIPDQQFRRVFFGALIIMALFILWRSLSGIF